MPKYFFHCITAGTLLMLVVMSKTGATLKTAGTPLGILDLEFARSVEKASAVLSAWKPNNNIEVAKTNTHYDFIFILFYTVFLYAGCTMIAGKYSGVLQKTGHLLAAGALAAGLLDVLENVGMLATLNGHLNNAITLFTFLAAVTKWMVALLALLYFLLLGAVYLVQKK
jgi:hypothetical protein